MDPSSATPLAMTLAAAPHSITTFVSIYICCPHFRSPSPLLPDFRHGLRKIAAAGWTAIGVAVVGKAVVGGGPEVVFIGYEFLFVSQFFITHF